MPLGILVSPEDSAAIGAKDLKALATVYGGFFAPASLDVEVSLVSWDEMEEINNEYRNLNEATDVLSFPLYNGLVEIRAEESPGSLLGSIVICPEKAIAYEETLPQLLHHGLVHLSGFDHETDLTGWKEIEALLLDQLKGEGIIVPGIPL